ncbi:Uncharacterized protein APZ42_010388, partial [Daphnia magna]
HGTPIDWYNFCREVSEDIVINNSEKIGGVGITVEIDESKFGKRKYNRGKRVEGVYGCLVELKEYLENVFLLQ